MINETDELFSKNMVEYKMFVEEFNIMIIAKKWETIL